MGAYILYHIWFRHGCLFIISYMVQTWVLIYYIIYGSDMGAYLLYHIWFRHGCLFIISYMVQTWVLIYYIIYGSDMGAYLCNKLSMAQYFNISVHFADTQDI